MDQTTTKPNSKTPHTSPDGLSQLRNILLSEPMATLDRRIQRLEKSVADLEKKLDQKLKQMEQHFTTSLEAQKNATDAVSTELNQVKSEVRSILKKFRDELTEKIKDINESKMNRGALADLFVEASRQIRGNHEPNS